MEQLTFCFKGHDVRFVEGKPIANDVAFILGYADPAATVTKKVKAKYKGVAKIATPGGLQSVTVLEEGGIYQLVLSSKLPVADEFQDWLFEEVLPSIRKTGSYQLKPMTPGELLLQQAQFMIELERKQTQLQEEQIRLAVEQQVTKVLAEQANTKVELVDTKVTNLEVEVSALKSILNQPIPTCNQTARQRIVEIAQLTADLLTKKGVYATV